MTDQSEQPTRADGTQPVGVMARLLNLTPRHLQRLATDGVIPKAARGRYELVPVVQGYVKYLQDLAAGKGDDAHKTATTDLAIARAEKAQRENMKAAAEVIPTTEIVVMVQGMFGYCRAKILPIPTKLAPVLFICETVNEIKEKLTEALKEALLELSETRAVALLTDGDRTGRRARGNGSVAGMEAAAGSNRKRVGRSKARPKSGKRRRAGKVADKPG